jgi:hypothetical protein
MARDEPPTPRPLPPADERSAHAFAEGYGEGLKDALREVLQHASRGHTAQELRWLIESRLARVPEEVELKRRSLLGPPRRVAWDTILRPPATVAPATAAPTLDTVLEGTSLLFREPQPVRATACVNSRWRRFGRVVALTRRTELGLGVPEESLIRIPLGRSREGGGEEAGLDPGEAAGRVPGILADGPAIVFLDSVEFIVREYGDDVALRLIEWLVPQIRGASGLLVVSVDPSTIDPISFNRIQRLFASVQ